MQEIHSFWNLQCNFHLNVKLSKPIVTSDCQSQIRRHILHNFTNSLSFHNNLVFIGIHLFYPTCWDLETVSPKSTPAMYSTRKGCRMIVLITSMLSRYCWPIKSRKFCFGSYKKKSIRNQIQFEKTFLSRKDVRIEFNWNNLIKSFFFWNQFKKNL